MTSVEELQIAISPKFDEAVINKIVESYSSLKNIKIIQIDSGAAATKGDSYMSVVTRFRIQATGSTESGEIKSVAVPVIVKSLPNNIGRRKTFRATDFFENEAIFYEKVWAELREFQKSKNIQNPFDDIPLLLSSWSDGENDYIALEDLKNRGFENVIRSDSLGYDHTALIMKLFGRFHGLSYAYKQQNPEAFEVMASRLKETYFAEKYRCWYGKYQEQLVAITRHAVEQELPNEYLDKFDEFLSKDFYGLLCQLTKIRESLSVITHGDAWIPNFFIKYDENKIPLRAMMIDFQFTRYSIFSNDIMMFLLVCIDEEMRTKHWDAFLAEYHNAFTDIVRQLGSDPNAITLDVLRECVQKYGSFGLGNGIEAVIMSLLDESDVSDFDTVQGDDAVPIETICVLKPFESPVKRKQLANVIKYVVDHNFI